MTPGILRQSLQISALGLLGALLPVSLASAQGVGINNGSVLLPAADTEVSESKRLVLPVIRIDREGGQRDFQGLYGAQTTDVNLGLEITPVEGLSLHADAWTFQDRRVPAGQPGGQAPGWQARLPQPLLEQDATQEFGLNPPFLSGSLEGKGIDLGASYAWEAGKVGKFKLSTSATYIHDFEQRSDLGETAKFLGEDARLPGSPDLQSSLTLTWELGNHTASAVTNYFDSFQDISELNMDEINELVENITTVDLQYGYNVKTGKQDRAIVSFTFGIRNIFDKKTTQILNQNSRVVDQNGRVAYGSIKYQF